MRVTDQTEEMLRFIIYLGFSKCRKLEKTGTHLLPVKRQLVIHGIPSHHPLINHLIDLQVHFFDLWMGCWTQR